MTDFEDNVRTEAYLIWESEGRPHGQDGRHWLMAMERVETRAPLQTETPVVPLSLKRVALNSRVKQMPQTALPLRASA